MFCEPRNLFLMAKDKSGGYSVIWEAFNFIKDYKTFFQSGCAIFTFPPEVCEINNYELCVLANFLCWESF